MCQVLLYRIIRKIIDTFDKKTGKKDYYRVAYSIPESVMFLDIETTGLSPVYHYVTLIGWMLNGEYNCWITGTDPAEFICAIKKAQMIITFNGSRFDCKFIEHIFPELHIHELPNLDLMHFCRRYGYTNGQKAIEKKLGFKRSLDLNECNGKEAIALWYKFVFGDDHALDSLIRYNFYDVKGMTFILDKIFFNRIYGKKIPKLCKPAKFYSAKQTCKISYCDKTTQIRKYANSHNFNLQLLDTSKNYRIIGIDLAGVVNKTSKTGVCLLTDNKATTKVILEDDKIIEYIIDSKTDIVSIDAPLSLPSGRTSVYNDDPMREKAGIMRYSERELHKRGVNSYPALIDSMQELTKRGINLSNKLRKMGYPVIECFPGAAQDILQLPRKKADPELLKAGLVRLGISGDFETRKVVHDELDAITAAIVGRFFIDGFYEPIGIPEENDMIVPSVKKREEDYEIIIGIAGNIDLDKTILSKYGSSKKFSYFKYSETIVHILRENGTHVNHVSFQKKENEIFNSGQQYLLNQKIESELKGSKRAIIDGMRHCEDFTYWKERCFSNFHLVYIDAKEETSVSNCEITNRSRLQEMRRLRNLADITIKHEGSLNDLYFSINTFIQQF